VLQVQLFVPGPVLAQAALGSQPPWFVEHEFTAVHTVPLPEYPALHAQLFVPGPVLVQAALGSHPPFAVAQALIAVQVWPSPA
jgi:hypothetical protein